jgi:hypothetical protein
MLPNPSFANAETVDRRTQQLVWFLKAFPEERHLPRSGILARKLCRYEEGRVRDLMAKP